MNLMICLQGDPDQLPYLPAIEAIKAGIELQGYGLGGIRSETEWQQRMNLQRVLVARFTGSLALHGPFIGMDYTNPDYLLREAVLRRLTMTLELARSLGARRVILHSGDKVENVIFDMQEIWLKHSVEFWKREIQRWAEAGIEVVLENDVQKTPDLLIRLAGEVGHPNFGLCFDIGHQHFLSEWGPAEWVKRMGALLFHAHLHDNDRTGDRHWPLGKGTIDFDAFFGAVRIHAPRATLSIEVEDDMEAKMESLRRTAMALA